MGLVSPNPEISDEVVNAFVVPIVEVIKTCVGLDAELSMIDVTNQIDPPPWLCVTIDVKGKLAGPITWVVSEELARLVAGKMLATEAIDGLNLDTCNEAVAELANIIAGNATGRLSDAGYDVEILPPQPVGVSESDRRLQQATLVVTLRTAAGKIKLLIGLRIHNA